MRRISFNQDWTFQIWGVPGRRPVTLPHDYSQELPRSADSKSGAAGGWFQGANLVYERDLEVTGEMLGERILLAFDGVSPGAEVYLDDMLVTRQSYGCVSFFADLTPFLRPGTRRIRVNVHGDALPNSRWYTGAGICRPVSLLRAPRACILPRGLHIRTAFDGSRGWILRTRVTASEEAARAGSKLCLSLRDASGRLVWRDEKETRGPETAFETPGLSVLPWSPDHPERYTLSAELREGDSLLDEEEIRVGFRTVALDRERGLLLNGTPMKLRGGCVHEDHGLLGAVSLADAETRKASLLREQGFNAVRCAHNPPAPSFLDACDELGLLVMDEFTDVWNIGKNPYDYHLFFRDGWREDLRGMILRDRNHPSVILWSIGNELPERDGSGGGEELCREMCALIRGLDDTRPITSALNHIGRRRLDMLDANLQADETGEIDYFGRCSEKFLSTLDVAGYNYLFRRYGKDLETWPGRFICGTESVAKEAYASWQETLKHPRVIGDFAWAAMDYLGEAGIGHIWRRPEDGEGYFERWPWRQANCGDLDLTGFRTPAGFYRRAVWGMPEGPYIAVRPPEWEEDGQVSYWAWPPREPAWDYPGYEGRPVLVEVYSPEKEVTLTLNGQPVGKKSCEACAAAFTLAYQPGIIRAADAAGRETELRTPGPAAGIRLSAEARGELIFLTATLTDGEGTPCFFDHREISFQAAGGTLLGVGSADPATEEGFRSGKARAWRGRVSAVVRRGEGPVTVRASAPGLSEAVYTLPGP